MNVMQAISDVAALKGSFIEELLEVMQNGDFASPDEPMADGEKVVGEMNELERALHTLCKKYGATERALVNRYREEGDSIDPKEVSVLKAKLDCCRSRFQIATKLMWENIETRLADQKTETSTAWGVRSNGKIVLMFGDECDKLIMSMLGLSLSRGKMLG